MDTSSSSNMSVTIFTCEKIFGEHFPILSALNFFSNIKKLKKKFYRESATNFFFFKVNYIFTLVTQRTNLLNFFFFGSRKNYSDLYGIYDVLEKRHTLSLACTYYNIFLFILVF